MLFEATARLGVKTIVVGPDKWGDEQHLPYKKKNFIFRSMPVVGSPSFYTFQLKNLSRMISAFRPATVYSIEEPFTLFARESLRFAKECGCQFAIFTWENRVDYRIGDSFDRIEQDVIRDSDKIICGNKLAMKRMISCGADQEKLHVLLQTGVDTELFKPVEEINKVFDIIYHGRLVREKGLPMLENVARKMKLHLFTVGGRGSYHVKYGDGRDWTKYEDLPELINMAKIGVQAPFSFQGYQEQGNFSAAECMSAGLPVVISNNGSLPDNYRGAPLPTINEGDENGLEIAIKELLEEEDLLKLGLECRKWVIENLSVDVMGKKLLQILELI